MIESDDTESGQDEAALLKGLGHVNGIMAWSDGLYTAIACGCVRRFHNGDDLPEVCAYHGLTVICWVLKQQL